jgi:hypothetical protein
VAGPSSSSSCEACETGSSSSLCVSTHTLVAPRPACLGGGHLLVLLVLLLRRPFPGGWLLLFLQYSVFSNYPRCSSTGAKNLLQGDDNGHVGRPCEVSLAPPCPELFCELRGLCRRSYFGPRTCGTSEKTIRGLIVKNRNRPFFHAHVGL